MTEKSGFYIHIPFCRKKCDYCDFYSETNFDDNVLEQYFKALLKNINEIRERFPHIKPDTIFFGGGTPNISGINKLEEVALSVKKKFGSDIVETSCEINPDVISFDDIEKIMKSEIITRLSLGIQSFSRKAIDFIGRIQSEDFDEKIKFI
ncbi:MAG: radical SAM protein, partial [Candidatus Muiribacteriota bacterium]